jgi:hypothetical protein
VCGVWVSGAEGRGMGGGIDRCVGLAWMYDADEHAREDPWEGRYCILIGCYVGWFVPFCYFYFKPFQIGFLWSIHQNHGIVCTNDIILSKCVQLGMSNKVHFGCFPFLCIKSSFSIFWVSKWIFCVKQLPNIWCQLEHKSFIE